MYNVGYIIKKVDNIEDIINSTVKNPVITSHGASRSSSGFRSDISVAKQSQKSYSDIESASSDEESMVSSYSEEENPSYDRTR